MCTTNKNKEKIYPFGAFKCRVAYQFHEVFVEFVLFAAINAKTLTAPWNRADVIRNLEKGREIPSVT